MALDRDIHQSVERVADLGDAVVVLALLGGERGRHEELPRQVDRPAQPYTLVGLGQFPVVGGLVRIARGNVLHVALVDLVRRQQRPAVGVALIERRFERGKPVVAFARRGVGEQRLDLSEPRIAARHRPHADHAIVGRAGDVVAAGIDAAHHVAEGRERLRHVQFLAPTVVTLADDVEADRRVATETEIDTTGVFDEVLALEGRVEAAVTALAGDAGQIGGDRRVRDAAVPPGVRRHQRRSRVH